MSAGLAFPAVQAVDALARHAEIREQYDANKQSMNHAFSLSQDAQVQAPSNYVSGLRQAGLPISLALHGSFQPASTPSPMPVSAPHISSAESINALANAELMSAQARKLSVDTEASEIDNDMKQLELNRKTSEDSTINENMRNMYAQRALSDPDNADFWNSRAKSVNDYDLGSLAGQSRFDDEIINMDNRRLRLLDNSIQERVKRLQLGNDSIIRSMASLPQDTRIKIYQDIAKSKSEIVHLASQNLKDDADISKANVEAQKILSDIDHAYNSDLVANVRNGDYVGALLILGSTIAKEASAGAGAAAVGAATRNPAGAVAGYRNARARAPERAHAFPR